MSKEIKRFDFARKPNRGNLFWLFIAKHFVAEPQLMGFKLKITKKNMDGLKAPYMILATHQSELDMAVTMKAIEPYRRSNSVCAIDGIRDNNEFLMRQLGVIGKRKFIRDFNLIRNMRHCVNKYKNIVIMYPEARYTLDGCASFLPDSLAKMCKLLGVPVVTLRMQGLFIIGPQWNKKRQKLPIRAEMEQIATAQQVKDMSVDELNALIRDRFKRDDFQYQLDNKIENNYKNRAQGLHHILYRCPHCNTEFEMYSKGTRLWCEHCGKAWQMSNLGQLSAENGETEFSHIPDWFNWERQLVREEVRNGSYHFEDEVTVHTLPNGQRFYDQGVGKLVQTVEGTVVDCTAYGKPFHLELSGAELESLHIEYDYPYQKRRYRKNCFGDCVDISTADDSFWLHPINKRTQLTKLSFATEEIHLFALEKIQQEKKS